ncbi:magnesium/cobalt transporter CorA [Candidatus Woesearchaeota archaeon]|nr:magnesium/cobalt transporter CorA [Candidatus Woesearchaeota archaeon]
MIEIFYVENGKLKSSDANDLHKLRKHTLWLDITGITKAETELLHQEFNIHPLTSEDLFKQNTRIKVEEFNDYLFCIFYGIEKRQKVELIELDFVIGKDFVISNHKAAVRTFDDIKKNHDLVVELLGKGPDFVFHRLIDKEIENYFPILDSVGEEIEKIEEQVTRKPGPELLDRILTIKRRITRIKKYALPQREKAGVLAKGGNQFLNKKALPYFRDLYDHTVRVSDSVDNYREHAGNTFDIYMSAVSNRMNEVMKVLSIIATIALPLTVISGIYGTNFANLPGAAASSGFWFMIAAMFLMAISMVLFFKRRGWF